jgi:hypothetical protein
MTGIDTQSNAEAESLASVVVESEDTSRLGGVEDKLETPGEVVASPNTSGSSDDVEIYLSDLGLADTARPACEYGEFLAFIMHENATGRVARFLAFWGFECVCIPDMHI